jgi:hypothetical protein
MKLIEKSNTKPRANKSHRHTTAFNNSYFCSLNHIQNEEKKEKILKKSKKMSFSHNLKADILWADEQKEFNKAFTVLGEDEDVSLYRQAGKHLGEKILEDQKNKLVHLEEKLKEKELVLDFIMKSVGEHVIYLKDF